MSIKGQCCHITLALLNNNFSLGLGFFFSSTSVTSAKVAVNGVHLHYQRTGEGEHAVLLLPGMLGLEGFNGMLLSAVQSVMLSQYSCQILIINFSAFMEML